MSFKAISFTIILLLSFTMQLNLIPDNVNPLIVDLPSKAKNPTLQIKFKFPAESNNELGPRKPGSSGLGNGQFIGVQFPSSLASNLNFDNNLDWNCALSDGTYNYNVNAVKPNSSSLTGVTVKAENNVAYCQLNDASINVPLKIGLGITYTLKISFTKNYSISFFRGLSLFTSTSNTPDKVVIDTLLQLGSFALYNDWESALPKALDILDGAISITKGYDLSSNILYPGSVFDISFQLISSAFIRKEDHLIVLKYPAAAVTPPVSVSSSEIKIDDKTYPAILGNLSFRQFGDNSLVLEGLNEDLVSGRRFMLNLKGLVALNTDLTNIRMIEIYVYYKNSYSVISYASKPVISVRKDILTVSANHPEFWDIYRNAAWPIKFTFKSRINLKDDNGLYVVIRQDNTLLSSDNGGNIVTFVASTCDFSENISFDNSFGKRPSCFPLRLDHKYENASINTPFKGSGIFFYLPSQINADQEFYLTVWLFADSCGGLSFDNIKGAANTSPTFEVSIHRQIRTNYLNESRFDFSKVLADGSGIFSGKCWNNKIQSLTITGGETINTSDDNFKSDFNDDITANTPSMFMRFKEIFSWRIGSSLQTAYLNDISTNINEQFLYSQSNAITSDSFFVAEADLNLASNSKLSSSLPGSIQNDSLLPGSLTIQFSKNWFIGTDNFKSEAANKCYFSWALANPPLSNPKNRKILNIDITSSSSQNLINFIGASGHTSSDIDTTQSLLTMTTNVNKKENIMKLVSERNPADGTQKWSYFPNEIPSNSITKIAWYSNCLKWKTSSNVKSLFTYIDIQFIWTYISGTGSNANTGIFSNVRLIKLFPEGGVFHDKSKVAGIAPVKNPYINHSVLSNSNFGVQSAVCLVELDGSAISGVASGDTNSGVFSLWMGFGSLLETDYSDASVTYPIGSLVDNSFSYGLQSQSPMHPENLYVSEGYTTQNVPLYVELNQLENPKVFGGTSGKPLKGETTSSYHFLMGSLIIIGNISGGKIQSTAGPIFIPYYCPYAYPNNNSSIRKFLNFAPSIFGAWLNMIDYSKITNVNRFLYYGDLVESNVTNKVSILLSRVDSTTTIKSGAYKGTGGTASGISSSNKMLATLRWNTYIDPNNKNLNVYSGTKNGGANNNMTCTGFSLFFNLATVKLDDSVAFSIFSGSLGYYNSSKVFYVSGKPFKTAAFWGGLSVGKDTTTGNVTGRDPSKDASNSFQITGITRPTLDTFVNSNGELVTSDKVGFSCAPADTTQYDALVNYFYDDPNKNTNFLLDFAPSGTTNWEVSAEFDSTESYLNDSAGYSKFHITTPSTIPAGSLIAINSLSFTQQTVCGIVVSGKYSKDCDYPSYSIFSCLVPYTSTTYDICCYNIQLSSSINLTTLKVNFQTEKSNSGLIGYLAEYIYDASSQITNKEFNFATKNGSGTDIIKTKSATISSVTYNQSNQISGIGKITLAITLPREPARSMVISVVGDMSRLIVQGTTPRCYASFSNSGTFGSNWDSGDAIIESCAFSSTSTPIIITTKNLTYKCGQSFSKTLYISLWPIIVTNWSDPTVTNSFKVILKDSKKSDLALNNQTFKLNLTESLLDIPKVAGQWENLCAVSSITPGLPGEIADYTFDVDLDTNATLINASNPNEVTIYWPFNLYGSYISNVYCYYNGKKLNCYFSDEGILNIRFSSILPIGSGKKISIMVTGIPNPEVNNDVIFACTVNNTNFSSGKRTIILTGSGKLNGGINMLKVAQTGNLRFLTVATPFSNSNPREPSNYTFRITFDIGIGLTNLPIKIDNTPIFHIYFPSEYNLAWYTSKPTASIEEYSSDDKNIISKTQLYTPSVVVQSGNRVTLILNFQTIELGINFRYWDIILSNIINPIDTTVSPVSPKSQTTSPYYITLTNSIESAFYNTMHNINTYVSAAITGMTYNLLLWNRGNSFSFDNTKWIIDIYNNNQLNKLFLRPGRYSVASFEVRPNNLANTRHAATTITFKDDFFSTGLETYSISTTIQQPIKFLIGAPCGTAAGYYVSNFSSSDAAKFSPLSPVVIVVESSQKGIISFQNPPAVPIGGFVGIPISINEYNFETLNVNWDAADNSTNDVSSSLLNVAIKPSVDISDVIYTDNRVVEYSRFFFENSEAPSGPQLYKTSDPNDCWTFNAKTLLSVTVSGTISDIPIDIQLKNSFKYANAAIDNTLDKNSIKFQFTPPADSVILSCALVCINYDYPADEDILVPTKKENSLIKFFDGFYTNKTPVNIIFSNLVRGQQYKLRCIIQSVHSDSSKRSQASVNLETPFILGSLNSSTSTIMPVPRVPIKCIKWNFENSDSDTYRALLNYCQNIFSNGGFYNNGCVICTNYDASDFLPGLSLPTDIKCVPPTRLRFLQSSDNTSETQQTSFTVCPIPHPICKTDVGSNKTYNDLFQQLIDNTKTDNLLLINLNLKNSKLDASSPYTLISDTVNTPDITKLSVNIVSNNVNGSVSFNARMETTPSLCYWQISSNPINSPPSWNYIKACNSPWCGSSKVSNVQTTFSTNSTNLQPFTEGIIYNVFVGCTNDLPNSQKLSEIVSVGTFTFDKTTPVIQTTNSGYLKFSFFTIIGIIPLL